jgi:hypothetical protein
MAKRQVQLGLINIGQLPNNSEEIFRLIKGKIIAGENFEPELNEVFKNHRKLKDFSPEELLLFFYFLSEQMDV